MQYTIWFEYYQVSATYALAHVEANGHCSNEQHVIRFRKLECTKFRHQRLATILWFEVRKNVRIDRAAVQ